MPRAQRGLHCEQVFHRVGFVHEDPELGTVSNREGEGGGWSSVSVVAPVWLEGLSSGPNGGVVVVVVAVVVVVVMVVVVVVAVAVHDLLVQHELVPTASAFMILSRLGSAVIVLSSTKMVVVVVVDVVAYVVVVVVVVIVLIVVVVVDVVATMSGRSSSLSSILT